LTFGSIVSPSLELPDLWFYSSFDMPHSSITWEVSNLFCLPLNPSRPHSRPPVHWPHAHEDRESIHE